MHVTLIEVGLRDGLQGERKPVPTSTKLQWRLQLQRAGVKTLQLGAFVHPRKVPQMADTEELFSSQPTDNRTSALVLNDKGIARAREAGTQAVDLSMSVCPTHHKRNTGQDHKIAHDKTVEMIHMAKDAGMKVRAGLQCAFGSPWTMKPDPERSQSLLEAFSKAGADELSLADTKGCGHPHAIRRSATMAQEFGLPVVLHLHDTYGRAMANLMAALDAGIRHFDTSFGGLGGCPFLPRAAGNLATEDVAFLLEDMGISTGIDWRQVALVSRQAEGFLGRQLPAKATRLEADEESP